MKLRNKFLSLVSAVSLVAGATVGNNSHCLAMDSSNQFLKMVLLGDAAVGKTSIINRLMSMGFEENQPSTVGVSYNNINFCFEGESFHLNIWDTAGQEKYRAISPMYLRGSNIVVLVFDLSEENRQMVKENLENWINMAKGQTNERARFVLVGNKEDLCPKGGDSLYEDYTDFQHKYAIPFFILTSARTEAGIPELSNILMQLCAGIGQEQEINNQDQSEFNCELTSNSNGSEAKKCC